LFCAQLTNDALLTFDPELEYASHNLYEDLLIVKQNEDSLEGYGTDEVGTVEDPLLDCAQ